MIHALLDDVSVISIYTSYAQMFVYLYLFLLIKNRAD